MSASRKEVARVPVCLEKGIKYQVELVGNEVVISKEVERPEWLDITNSCFLEYRASQHCSGHYIVIMYRECGRDRMAVVIGTQGLVAQKGYKIEKAPLAYTSFRVFKKNR